MYLHWFDLRLFIATTEWHANKSNETCGNKLSQCSVLARVHKHTHTHTHRIRCSHSYCHSQFVDQLGILNTSNNHRYGFMCCWVPLFLAWCIIECLTPFSAIFRWRYWHRRKRGREEECRVREWNTRAIEKPAQQLNGKCVA